MYILLDYVERELKSEESYPITEDDLVKCGNEIASASKFTSDFLKSEESKLIADLSVSLFEIRLSKWLEGKRIEGFDSSIFKVFEEVKRFYVDLVQGKIRVKDNKVQVKLLRDLHLGEVKSKEGQTLYLPIESALRLMIAGYLTPLTIDSEDTKNESP